MNADGIALAAYLGHLDGCERGCRPVPDRRYSRAVFVEGTGKGCSYGLRLAADVERVQAASASNQNRQPP